MPFWTLHVSVGRLRRFSACVTISLFLLLSISQAPAATQDEPSRLYIVEMEAPSLADHALAGRRVAERIVARSADAAIETAERLDGQVIFRFTRLLNGFSARLTPEAARTLMMRPDVRSVELVSVVQAANSASVPYIGAPKVWKRYGVTGKGVEVAVVDSGVDYTHATFGGPGTRAAYDNNDPRTVEPGTFPTAKVVGGYDFVGENYNISDPSTGNDIPAPDRDPLEDRKSVV